MVIYHYDRSGVLLGAGEAKPSPAEGLLPDGTPKAWLIPARATTIQPPRPGSGEVAVFNEENKTWSLQEDHRGASIWNTMTMENRMVTDLGPLPDGWTTFQPQDRFQTWDGSRWTTDVEKLKDVVRSERNAKLAACDWTQLPDSPVSADLKAAWGSYRQALRDFMAEWAPGKPWPEAPA